MELLQKKQEARKAEFNSEWEKALSIWGEIEGKEGENYKAVELIIEAIERGNSIRREQQKHTEILCEYLKEQGLTPIHINGLCKVKKALMKGGFEYDEVMLLHVQDNYDEYFETGHISAFE